MNNDDWDAVSSPVEDTGVTNSWDEVSTLTQPEPPDSPPRQSSRPDALMMQRQDTIAAPPGPPSQGASAFLSTTRWHISASFLIRLGLFIVVIVGLFAAGHFGAFRVAVGIDKVNTSAAATANAGATALAQGNATATAQTAAAATTLQQLYTRATSGTPMIDDPLSDNSQGYAWGVLNLGGGDTCGFTGGMYHLAMANSDYSWMTCVGRNIYLNNFAFQVQESIVKPGDAGILFGATPNGFYRMDVNSGGSYTLYYQDKNNQFQTLQSGTSPAINAGLNQSNVITLIVYNGILYFYANNQFVVSANLNVYGLTYTTGTFGFAAANFGQPTEVIYTNLKVWTL